MSEHNTVTKLLSQDAMVGSVGKVYGSLSNLERTNVVSTDAVSSLLNPCVASTSSPNTNFLLPAATHKEYFDDKIFYICSNTYHHYNVRGSVCDSVSVVKGASCPRCNESLITRAQLMKPKFDGSVVVAGSREEGYVKGVVTYSVMDDLTVLPMSTISSITLLSKLQIKDLGLLEEETVSVS